MTTAKQHFVQTWGWVLPTLMIPIALAAMDGRYQRSDEHKAHETLILELKTNQAVMAQHSMAHVQDSDIHTGYRNLSKFFVPRTEIYSSLQHLREQNQNLDEKLDRLYKHITSDG